MTSEAIIRKLQLAKHPEGGFYRETYRGKTKITLDDGRERHTATAIYYLLKDNDKSHFHQVASDELWLFHQGAALEIKVITGEGKIETNVLGNRLDLDEEPQLAVKANTWFAAQLRNGKGFFLVSCIVAPGFDFADFTLARKEELAALFPALKREIDQLSL